jgi:hypothetical protein
VAVQPHDVDVVLLDRDLEDAVQVLDELGLAVGVDLLDDLLLADDEQVGHGVDLELAVGPQHGQRDQGVRVEAVRAELGVAEDELGRLREVVVVAVDVDPAGLRHHAVRHAQLHLVRQVQVEVVLLSVAYLERVLAPDEERALRVQAQDDVGHAAGLRARQVLGLWVSGGLLRNSKDTMASSWVRQKFFMPLSLFMTPPASITDWKSHT